MNVKHDLSKKQVRNFLMSNGISGHLGTEAMKRLLSDDWNSTLYGPTVTVIDTLTDKAAAIIVQGPEEFDVHAFELLTGQEVLELAAEMHSPSMVDKIVVKG